MLSKEIMSLDLQLLEFVKNRNSKQSTYLTDYGNDIWEHDGVNGAM